MKKTTSGALVTGIVFAFIGAIWLFIVLAKNQNVIVPCIFLLIGAILIVANILANNNTKRENIEWLRQYKGKVFVTVCHFCGHEVDCHAEDFSEHRNYPEGFVYCPVCHKPLSINAFKVMNEGRRNLPPNQYEYHYDEWEDD